MDKPGFEAVKRVKETECRFFEKIAPWAVNVSGEARRHLYLVDGQKSMRRMEGYVGSKALLCASSTTKKRLAAAANKIPNTHTTF